jgi:1-acyl-sn-glycerol-3-phosphate acyltransferase
VYPYKLLEKNEYRTPDDYRIPFFLNRRIFFLRNFLRIVIRGGQKAQRGEYTGKDWAQNSYDIYKALENAGIRFHFHDIHKSREPEGPVVYSGNHMSVLETGVLPMLIQPFREATFVIKKELLVYPYFRDILKAIEAIVVMRRNPREDFAKVMKEGTELIKRGKSIILFPQATRQFIFDPANYNSLAIKLAKRAGVPIVPLALVSDAWQNGHLVKDFGPLKPEKEVHIKFGDAIDPATHPDPMKHLIEFIRESLREWNRTDLLIEENNDKK